MRDASDGKMKRAVLSRSSSPDGRKPLAVSHPHPICCSRRGKKREKNPFIFLEFLFLFCFFFLGKGHYNFPNSSLQSAYSECLSWKAFPWEGIKQNKEGQRQQGGMNMPLTVQNLNSWAQSLEGFCPVFKYKFLPQTSCWWGQSGKHKETTGQELNSPAQKATGYRIQRLNWDSQEE